MHFLNPGANILLIFVISPLLGPRAGKRRILDSTKSEEIWVSSCFLAWEQWHTGQHPFQHIAAQLYSLNSTVFTSSVCLYNSWCPQSSQMNKTSMTFTCTSFDSANSLSSNRKSRKEKIYDDKEGLAFTLSFLFMKKFNV